MTDGDSLRRELRSSGPTARDLATALFRRKRILVGVAGVVLAVTIWYAIFGTKYQANIKVLLRRGRADAPATAQQDAPLDLTRMTVTEEEVNSEVELLKDDEVLHKVADEAGLAESDRLHFLRPSEGRAQRVERAARRLAKKLQVRPIKKTTLITVSYACDDPQQAARVLQSVANAYLDKHTLVHRPGGEVRFFDQQKGEARLQLEEAKNKLLQFTSRHGVVAASQQRDLARHAFARADPAGLPILLDVAPRGGGKALQE